MKPQRWRQIPKNKERERLAKLLQGHMRDAGVPLKQRTMEICREETLKIIAEQNWSCAFSGGSHKYCWNGKQNRQPYIVLRWGHKTPRSRRTATRYSDYFLLCERCNNQIQTSRTLKELRNELVHKIEAIQALCA